MTNILIPKQVSTRIIRAVPAYTNMSPRLHMIFFNSLYKTIYFFQFSGKHVVLIAQLRILPKPKQKRKDNKLKQGLEARCGARARCGPAAPAYPTTRCT